MRRLAAGFGLMLLGAAPPAERVVGGDALVAVSVNGAPLTLRIEPSALGLPLLAPGKAQALGLKGGGLFAFGIGFAVGRERFQGRTEDARFAWAGGKPDKRRVGWMSRAYVPAADGTIGPAGVPEPVVRFQLRPARSGETTTAVPLNIEGGLGGALFGSWFTLDGMVQIDGTPVRVRFDPYRPTTLVTAPTALALARAHGGIMTAATGRQEIAFGVERPYRVMKLSRALIVGGVALTKVGVRVTDEDVAGKVPEEGAAAAAQDPDEVVVTARVRKPRPGLLLMGADALSACSAITFDKPAKVVRLSCATGG